MENNKFERFYKKALREAPEGNYLVISINNPKEYVFDRDLETARNKLKAKGYKDGEMAIRYVETLEDSIRVLAA